MHTFQQQEFCCLGTLFVVLFKDLLICLFFFWTLQNVMTWVGHQLPYLSSNDWLTDWPTYWLTYWLNFCSSLWLVDFLTDFKIVSCFDWMTFWLTDWLSDLFTDRLLFCLWLYDWLTFIWLIFWPSLWLSDFWTNISDWLTFQLCLWLSDWVMDCLSDWPIFWMSDLQPVWLTLTFKKWEKFKPVLKCKSPWSLYSQLHFKLH